MHIAGGSRRALVCERVLQLLAQERGFTPQLFQFGSIGAGQGHIAGCSECFRTL